MARYRKPTELLAPCNIVLLITVTCLNTPIAFAGTRAGARQRRVLSSLQKYVPALATPPQAARLAMAARLP